MNIYNFKTAEELTADVIWEALSPYKGVLTVGSVIPMIEIGKELLKQDIAGSALVGGVYFLIKKGWLSRDDPSGYTITEEGLKNL